LYRILLLRVIAGVIGGYVAQGKGRNMLLWGLACALMPLVVLVVLLVPPVLTRGQTKRCPHCSRIIPAGDTVCRYCKKELPIELVQCKECGSFVPERDYCSNCHRKLKV
jgi:RNA polymerase subunit RPABC4/transcription elongation factor Spt4